MNWRTTFLPRLLCGLWMLASFGPAMAQFGGGMPGPRPAPKRAVQEPNSEIAAAIRDEMGSEVALGEIETTLTNLDEVLTERLEGLPVFIDGDGLAIAEIEPGTKVNASIVRLPLRSALRELLSPFALRAVIENEGLVITADFAALARRGIATDRWVNDNPEFTDRVKQAFDRKYDAEFDELPLSEVVTQISRDSGLPVIIDGRALEEIGLSDDQPVSLHAKGISLRSALRLILRNLDLSYMTGDDVVMVTTIEAAEQQLQSRIYWLEATGLPVGDFDAVINLIQSSIIPDTWEALGGPSTIIPMTSGEGNRPAILVSTIYPIHEEIEKLLAAMRESHVGPDPQLAPPVAKKPAG